MQKPRPHFRRPGSRRREGVALVIVLAFVVILTGVIVAYFTRSLSNRQISNSSANQTKVSLFAQGAADTIIADLQEEIVLSSSVSNTTISGTTFTSYTPSSPATMLPQIPGPVSPVTSWAPNLLTYSGSNQSFFTNTTGNGNIKRNTIAVSSTIPSLNGRSVSLARWNSHYLLPLFSGTDSTPISSGANGFIAPDWILVARDGLNPLVTNPSQPVGGEGPATWSGTNASTVIGRYAYAIYHEGGLLDANVAGYPSSSNTNGIVTSKASLAYADLTLAHDPQDPGLTQSQVDQLVAWRNGASSMPQNTYNNSGSLYPNATGATGSTSALNYYTYATNNPGFLTTSSTNLNNYNGNPSSTQGVTDRFFSNRQELISFMQNGLGLSGAQLNVLNYLATFTRGLDEPSYSPDPTRPLISGTSADIKNGGNNVITNGSSHEILDANQKNDPINPAFPSLLVTGTFLRDDGSLANPGDPLVKTRFALSRLAWLTYKGPSGGGVSPLGGASTTPRTIPTVNPGITSPDYDMWQLVHTYGVSPSYLAKGTAANIYKYFGLVWMQDTWSAPSLKSGGINTPGFNDGEYKWFYMGHQSLSGASPGGNTTATSSTTGSISRLGAIANLGSQARDPDFFELLKASVAAGSLGKASLSVTTLSTDSFNSGSPYVYQAQYDANLDYAIIQLGANIIDQAKVDGYSTRIVFNDGAGIVHEFRGVQNLPYLYRFNSGDMDLREENPAMPEGTHSFSGTLKDTGIAVVMEVPTIWNPYDANSPPGIPGPVNNPNANFRIIADSAAPDSLAAQTASASTAAGLGYNTFNASAENSNGTTLAAGTNASQKYWSTATNGGGTPLNPPLPINAGVDASALVPSNAEMDFNITTNQLFREPTILAMNGFPSACNLRMPNPPTAISQISTILNTSGSNVLQQSGGNYSLSTESPNPLDLPTPPTKAQGYIGVCAAIYPIEFSNGTTIYHTDIVNFNVSNGPGPDLTFRLQYTDPNGGGTTPWATYDEKYTQFATNFLDTPFNDASGNLTDSADHAQGGDWQSYADPRTGRFGAVNGRDFEPPVSTPGETGEVQEWADSSTGDSIGPEIVTTRPDINAGYAVSSNRGGTPYEFAELVSNLGWFVNVATGGHYRIGMLEQNNSTAKDNGIRFSGDNINNSSKDSDPPTYYADPDGVTRGAMGWYTPTNGKTAPATVTLGLPLATAYLGQSSFAVTSGTYQAESRPYFLHRPYRSVAELGYVFSGTPWKNIDFFTPQSGNVAMLDVFSAFEPPPPNNNPNPLVAGVVDLNTRQTPVLQSILSGAYIDEALASGTVSTPFSSFSPTQTQSMLAYTSGSAPGFTQLTDPTNNTPGQGPLENVSDLVGRWNLSTKSFIGMAGYLGSVYASVFGSAGNGVSNTMQYVDRFREAFIRPLAAVGGTRVWNVMIDVIAQTGRYPQGAQNPANFVVDGEQRYWVHVAIDRYTGKVLDKQVEVVRE